MRLRWWTKRTIDLTVTLIIALIFSGCSDRSMYEKILFDFELDAELDQMRWRCGTLMSLSEEHVSHGRSSLKLEMFPERYRGMNAVLNKSDWRGYSSFCFDIYNPMEAPLSLFVWVDDGFGNGGLPNGDKGLVKVKTGWSTIELPLEMLLISGTERQIDFSRIRQFGFYLMEAGEKTDLYVDYIRLVK